MFGVMRSDVKLDWTWADGHLAAIADVLKQNAMEMLCVRTATKGQDLRRATDLVISVGGGDVAVRIRRSSYRKKYRDLTIRTWRGSGAKTERDKLMAGFGDWYLYGWSDGNGGLADWMLVDLDALRKSGLLESTQEISNRDNRTRFIAIADWLLRLCGCLVSEKQCALDNVGEVTL